LWESNALLALVELFHSLAHGKRCGCTLYLSSSSSSIVVVLLRKDGRVSRSDSFAQNNFIWLRDTVKITPGEAAQDNFIWLRDCQMRTIIWLILPSVYVFAGSSATLKFLKKVSDHTHISMSTFRKGKGLSFFPFYLYICFLRLRENISWVGNRTSV
jgi:hypothetical protein